MEELPTPFPLEVVVAGTPVSLQGSKGALHKWKGKVYSAALQRRDETCEMALLDGRALAVEIFYFSDAPMAGDIDNIVKPILDALIGVAYMDDVVVERVTAQKFEPETDWQFTQPSAQLASALEMPTPIVYIRVDDSLNWRALNAGI